MSFSMVNDMGFQIRKGVGNDMPFLAEMLREAVFWSGDTCINPDEIMSKPEISVILEDWGNTGDTAFIAETKEGEPIGAAWYRFYSKEKHSYGFVDEETPEIAIAVKRAYRRKGVGSVLLKSLIAEAIRQKIKKLCLSVDRSNYAVKIYKTAGFVNIVDEREDHWTMVAALRNPA